MPTLVLMKRKAKDKELRISSRYGIRYRCPLRRRSWVISTFCCVKKNAERRLREFCDLLERGQVGLDNPFKEQLKVKRELALEDIPAINDCLAAFESDLRAGRIRKRGRRKPIRGDVADTTMARIRSILSGCEVDRIDQLHVDKVNSFLDKCQVVGKIKTAQTRKHYERAIKSFSKWLETTEQVARDPLARLAVTYVGEADVVHSRGEFAIRQVNEIIRAAAMGPRRAGLTGRQRAHLYLIATTTGFRARECAALRKCDFGEGMQFLTLDGTFTKNNKRAIQPLPPAIRQPLIDYLVNLAPEEFLWPGGWRRDENGRWVEAGWVKDRRAGEILRVDAALAGIVIGRKGKDKNGGKVLDFHSFRHTYISNLERAGVSVSTKEQLSRATAGVIERYTHRELSELTTVVERMPALDLSGLM